jgi:hypothetical protein
MQRWQSVGRCVAPALIGQAEKKNTLRIQDEKEHPLSLI